MYEDYYDKSSRSTLAKPAIADVLNMVDIILQSPTKRHFVGGALLSVSFLFGGLALTAMTAKTEERKYEDED